MKDTAVRPAGLFNTRRQVRLLDGLADRFQHCQSQQSRLQTQFAADRIDEETRYTQHRDEVTNVCRRQRREMLEQWDQADERVTAQYEADAIANRQELNRLAALFRRRLATEQEAINNKADSRCQAIWGEFDKVKNGPASRQRKETKRIKEALAALDYHVERARELTMRRLDHLPEVSGGNDSDDSYHGDPPQTVYESIKSINALTQQCEQVVAELQSGVASRLIDSYLIPASTVVFLIVWAVVAFFVAPPPPWVWMGLGIVPAAVFGFTLYVVVLSPLKKMTRRIYPEAERIGQAAEDCATTGRRISARIAAQASKDLAEKRDAEIDMVRQWQSEQINELRTRLEGEEAAERLRLRESLAVTNRKYGETSDQLATSMRTRADQVADQISEQLAAADHSIRDQRAQNQRQRMAQLERIRSRLSDGVRRGLDRITKTNEAVEQRFPAWSKLLAADFNQHSTVDYLPLGRLRIDACLRNKLIPQTCHAGTGREASEPLTPEPCLEAEPIDSELPPHLPVVLHRRLYSAVIIRSSGNQLGTAVNLVHQLLWRMLTAAPPSQAKLTLIDPLGRGQHFTSFMALADHDPTLVGHRVWTTDAKIEERMAELAHHVEDVLQASLRDRFERIEDYNEVAGSMTEPYRIVAAVGMPDGLSRDAYRHLQALIESGPRCGIFSVLICDRSKAWPTDMPAPRGDKVLELSIDDDGKWSLDAAGLQDLPFEPAEPPPVDVRVRLVEKIGIASVAASRVEIPLDHVLSSVESGAGLTDEGIDIPIGSQGADRSLAMKLGEGVRQHVLIAGKTGSGKSTLLHSIITSGAHRYRPDQLQYYLLDFKKGVEFKAYADSGFPHARVIGIESEREFGRSVLQRLDAELQERGEKLRAAGVQELAEYRRMSGEPLPRIMLVIDEFQELFIRDDRLASDCAMLLDRLVRQGRSFGIHVILSSQSLAGAYSLPRATLGQMAVRIAMQCSETDAALILSDDNTAARLISRPGEAIYNDAGGLLEGNQPFQVAWLAPDRHREMLQAIASRDGSFAGELGPPVIFEGNRPCRWTPALASSAIAQTQGDGLVGLLGEAVEIGPPLAVELTRDTGRNVLLMANNGARQSILASLITSIAKSDPRLEVIYFDGSRTDDSESAAPWFEAAGVSIRAIRMRQCDPEMVKLDQLVKQRGDEGAETPPLVVVVDPLERFRDLRQDDSFNFSLDAADGSVSGATALQNVLRDGPPVGVIVVLVCGSAETLSRWLPRPSQHDLELRVLGQMNQADSAMLIDSPAAAELSAATMLLYDDADGRIRKFRQCDLPDAKDVNTWLRT